MFGIRKHGRAIQRAAKRAQYAMGMFQQAYDELETANSKLSAVIDTTKTQAHNKLLKAQQEADALLAIAQQADRDMGINLKQQSKLKTFLEVE